MILKSWTFAIFEIIWCEIAGQRRIAVDGCMDGWVEVKAVLRIAYSDQKLAQTWCVALFFFSVAVQAPSLSRDK